MNLQMITRGGASAYRKYLKPAYSSEYSEDEKEARGKRSGLWQQSNPELPWEFRKK